jgi:hypothetical protein
MLRADSNCLTQTLWYLDRMFLMSLPLQTPLNNRTAIRTRMDFNGAITHPAMTMNKEKEK